MNAIEIAFLYKKRWEVELFFKWMKQQILLGNYSQCCKDPRVLRNHSSLSDRSGWLQIESWALNLRNITNPEYLSTG
ncbi:MAG: transposase [Bacteroidales bacterium]